MTGAIAWRALPPGPAASPAVLVLAPPFDLPDDFIDYPVFLPLATVQLAGALREKGHHVVTVDALCLPDSKAEPSMPGRSFFGAPWASFARAMDRACDRLGEAQVVVVGQSPFHHGAESERMLARGIDHALARFPSALVVLADFIAGGMHTLARAPGERLATLPPVHALAVGEADAAVPAVIEAWRQGRLEQARVVDAAVAAEDLRAPDWSLIDLDAYRAFLGAQAGLRRWPFRLDERPLPIIAGRGCRYACAFCVGVDDQGSPTRAARYRPLPWAQIEATLDDARARGIGRLVFLDGLLNASRRRFEALLDAVDARGLRFDAPNGFRADALSDEHLARLKTLCDEVSVSAESGSQHVVSELIGKKLALSEVHRVAATAGRLGLPLRVHFQLGTPGETRAMLSDTAAMIVDLAERHGAQPAVQFATPLPGTRLSRESRAHGWMRAEPPPDEWGSAMQRGGVLATSDFDPESLDLLRRNIEKRLRVWEHPKLIVNLTYACNNHCEFCATADRPTITGDLEHHQRRLEEGRSLGYTLLDLDGGEPTLAPTLIPLVKHARALGYQQVTLTSNGRLLSVPANWERLRRAGLTGLLISVHGAAAEIHDTVVNAPGACEETWRAIALIGARRRGLALFGVNTTVCRANVDHLDAIAHRLLDHDVPLWNLQCLTPFGRAAGAGFHPPEEERAAASIRRVLERFSHRLRIQIVNMPYCLLPGWEESCIGDAGKLGRTMVFLNDRPRVLAEYLGESRRRVSECEPCAYRVLCDGRYAFPNAPARPPERADAHASLRGAP